MYMLPLLNLKRAKTVWEPRGVLSASGLNSNIKTTHARIAVRHFQNNNGLRSISGTGKVNTMPSADEMLIATMPPLTRRMRATPIPWSRRTARAAELVYGRRMSAALSRMAPDASTHLRLAVRGQHIDAGPVRANPTPRARRYLQWRQDLKAFHARRVGEIMQAAGYGADDIARVGALVRKERLKRDGEAQTLEDVACIVFLEFYVEAFMQKTTTTSLRHLGQDVAQDVHRSA